ncbi:hypothetical protein AN633_01130, partial [Klebsiella pneumoniae]
DVYKRQIQSRGQCTEKMLRIIVEFLTKVGLDIEIKLVKLLQQEQRLILDEFSHVQRCFLLFRHKRPQSVSGQCRDLLFSASSLTQSLRSCRSAAASGRSMRRNARENRVIAWRKEGKAAQRPFFHRLRPPDEHHGI